MKKATTCDIREKSDTLEEMSKLSLTTFFFYSMLTPMSSDRQKALITAMAKILWQAGGQQHATVVL